MSVLVLDAGNSIIKAKIPVESAAKSLSPMRSGH